MSWILLAVSGFLKPCGPPPWARPKVSPGSGPRWCSSPKIVFLTMIVAGVVGLELAH